NDDAGSGIAVDSSGSSYVTGTTYSPDFPTANAFQPNLASTLGSNAFVTKFSPDGSALVYSTYLGGSSYEHGNGIAVDASSHAYVTGVTQSHDFPTTGGDFQTTCGCNDDAFVTKVSVDGATLLYSTYLGGNADDQGNGVAVDQSGSAYVTGSTLSSDFPTTNGAFETGSNGGAFVSKLKADGTGLVYSTYLGSGGDDAYAIAVDSSANALLIGTTSSGDFPTKHPIQSCAGAAGGPDVFVSDLNAQSYALVYSTCLGGSDENQGRGIAVDSSGDAYITGFTFAGDFPLVNPIETGHGGEPDSEAFVAKIARWRSSVN